MEGWVGKVAKAAATTEAAVVEAAAGKAAKAASPG
jgi:hypothetical protein